MTPKQAYDDTAARGRRLLELHDVLVNTRKRNIRGDWKASFCKLMHWSKTSPIHRVDSKQAIIILRPQAQLDPSDFSREAVDDLLRSALAFGVSALDRYAHERVVKVVVPALRKKNPSRNQQELGMPAMAALRAARAAVAARKAGRPFRPANEIRKAIQEALHKRPFQNWRELDYAFTLIGINNLETKLRAAYGVPSLNAVKDQLNAIARRRNQVVHEGDLVRHARGGNVRRHSITSKMVRESLDFLDGLVTKMETVT